MKKIIVLFSLLLTLNFSYGQAVSDNAIIPISVTLQSILRLNVTSGGNIEFMVNTIAAYTSGINNAVGTATRYDTRFTVSSSIDFDVDLYAETANFINIDGGSSFALANNLLYAMEETGTGAVGTAWALTPAAGAFTSLTDTPTEIVSSLANAGAGDILKNIFTINWELCGTNRGVGNSTLLAQSIAAGRYTANAFLVLRARTP